MRHHHANVIEGRSAVIVMKADLWQAPGDAPRLAHRNDQTLAVTPGPLLQPSHEARLLYISSLLRAFDETQAVSSGPCPSKPKAAAQQQDAQRASWRTAAQHKDQT